jgi:Major intrinsic protein/Malic enzyme, N-terminal domain
MWLQTTMMKNYRLLPGVSADRWRLETLVSGLALLGDPLLNRGTAFTPEEREELDLVGLLPSAVTTIDEQVKRSYAQYQQQPDDLSKNIFLTALQDRNEVLFYHLLSEHLAEMLPVVYDPTVALAIEQYSHEYRRPRGVYLSIDRPEDIETSFRDFGAGPDEIDLIVAAACGSLLARAFFGVAGNLAATMPQPGLPWQAAGFEAILTFGLVLMVLNLANGPKLNGPFVPLAVGAYIMAWGTMGGPFDGAAMNPARAFGPDLAIGDLSTWWVYLLGPLVGAVIAVGVAYVLRGPAKAQEALAAVGTPLDQTT